jgi:hypothetical protein
MSAIAYAYAFEGLLRDIFLTCIQITCGQHVHDCAQVKQQCHSGSAYCKWMKRYGSEVNFLSTQVKLE